MVNKTLLLPRLLLGLGTCAIVGPGNAQQKPNIIFVISDDHRWDCVGAAGNPNISTPNMDRLATEGVHFLEATIHNPQCSPSRAALITGVSTHTNGRYSNQTSRKDIVNEDGFDDYVCLPEALAAEGYATAFVGKWHLPADPWNVGVQQIGTWMPGGAGPYKGASLAEGKSRERTKNEGFVQEEFGKSAREIIQSHAAGSTTQPLFLWLATTAPHSPFQPNPAEASKPYEGKTAQKVLPPTFKGSLDKGDARKWLDYVAAITSVDLELGKLMDTLDKTGLSTSTVVVLLGDNGFMMGNRGLSGKAVPYEDSIRVPFMVWGPGVIEAKGKTSAVASSLDLPPTFLKLAGAEPPEQWHGRDLTPVLKDGGVHGTTWSVSEAPDYDNWKFPDISYRTVRTTGSKLIVWHESTGKQPEFYDTSKDPQEQTNLYDSPEYQAQVKELTQVLESWMRRTDDNWQMRGELEQYSGADAKPRKSRRGKGANNGNE